MLDFLITFLSNTTFTFTDNSDYTGLTVTSTRLRVYKPPKIDFSTFEEFNLFPEIFAAVGDSGDIDTSTLDDPFTLPDGVYAFEYIITLDTAAEVSLLIYTIKDLDLLNCKTNLVKDYIINGTSDRICKECFINLFDSMLTTAYEEITLPKENYKDSELIVEYLKTNCEICNC